MKETLVRHGFTLVEVLIVAACMVILIGPMLMVFRSGARTSLQGMVKVDTTLNARRIIRQIHTDLKQACLPVGEGTMTFAFKDILQESGTTPLKTYRFCSFPVHGGVDDVVPKTMSGKAIRRASTITYLVRPSLNPNNPFRELVRIESFHPEHPLAGTPVTRVLTDHVNFFEMKPMEKMLAGKNQFFFWVTLQLVDTPHSVSAGVAAAKQNPLQKPSELQIADFFDVVYPEFFHAFWNQEGMNRNWHTLIAGPGTAP